MSEQADLNVVASASAASGKLVKAPWFYKTGLLLRDPIAYMREIAKLGDFVQVRGLLSFYLINHPDLIRQVVKDKNDNMNRDNVIYERLRNVARSGLVASEGAYWQKQRRTMNPLFTPRAIKSYFAKMVAASEHSLARLQAHADKGEVFDAVAEMDLLTLEINAACLFNANLQPVYDDLQRWFQFVKKYMEAIPLPLITRPWFPSPANLKLKRTLAEMDAYINGLIAERKQNLDAYDDFLSVLLRTRDAETGAPLPDWSVRDEVLVAFIAGYETASTALCWCWWQLQQNPQVEARLHAELDQVLGERLPTMADVSALKYCRMFIDEVLRASPSAWLSGKSNIAADELWGVPLPPHSMLLTANHCIHEHPAFWDAPQEFNPERFRDGDKAAKHPYAYVPFSGGPHVCIGKHFALQEILVGLAVLARRFRLQVEPDFEPVMSAGISTKPKYPLRVRAIPR